MRTKALIAACLPSRGHTRSRVNLVADWFRRSMRIYTNVARLIESPNERVLLVYGAGHLGWLQFAFGSSPNIRLRKLAEFAK